MITITDYLDEIHSKLNNQPKFELVKKFDDVLELAFLTNYTEGLALPSSEVLASFVHTGEEIARHVVVPFDDMPEEIVDLHAGLVTAYYVRTFRTSKKFNNSFALRAFFNNNFNTIVDIINKSKYV